MTRIFSLFAIGLAGILTQSCAQTGARKTPSYAGFGRQSISEQTLRTFAPPPLGADLKNQIEKYMDIRSASAGLPSPGAKELYINWSVTGTSQVWKLDGPRRFPLQMTGGEDSTRVVKVSPDGRWLVLSRDSMGDEFYGIYLQSVKGGELIEVYRKPQVQASFQYFSSDSLWIYYVANDIQPASYAIYRYNVKTRERELVWGEPGIWRLADVRDNGEMILTKLTGSQQNEHYHFNSRTKEITPLIGQGVKEDFWLAFSPVAGEYFVLTNQLGEFRRLFLLREGKLTPVTPEWPYNVEYFRLDAGRRRLIYGINDKGYYRVRGMDARTRREIRLPSFDGAEQVSAGAFSQDGDFITFTVETPKAPAMNYVYHFPTRNLREWTLASSPEVSTDHFVGAQLEAYPAEDGTMIPMFVWRSKECETRVCPVVVNFHGGPESQFTPGFSPNINLFLEKGFVFVAPNVRGSDGYGKSWLRADNGPRRLDVISDIRDCARHIKKSWAKDGVVPRVGIYGGSYGGYSTFMGMSMFAGEYDAGVAIVGMSSLLTFLENTAPYRRELRINEYGDPVADRDALVKLSAVNYVDLVKDPLLIIHGATDPRVPAGEALQFYELIKKRVPGSGLILFPDEGHGVRKRPNRVLMQGYLLEFFDKHLKQ